MLELSSGVILKVSGWEEPHDKQIGKEKSTHPLTQMIMNLIKNVELYEFSLLFNCSCAKH